jgi:cytochrome c oxidase subunit 2
MTPAGPHEGATASPRTRRAALSDLLLGIGVMGLGPWAWQGVRAQSSREIEIVARRFQFTPNQIPLKLGEQATLLITALDFAHGFYVPDLGIRADLVVGLVTKIPILPKELGPLDFLCDNFCGDDHERMHGQFVVTK